MTPGLSVARKIAALPPWVLTAALLGLNVLANPIGLVSDFQTLSRALNWLLIAINMGWVWSVYTIAVAAMPERPRETWLPWVFAAPAVVDAIAAIANLSMNNSPAALVFFAAFLFCIGRTAIELETADHTGTPAGFSKTLGTALLLFFSVVGVWWLRQRLLRLVDRTAHF